MGPKLGLKALSKPTRTISVLEEMFSTLLKISLKLLLEKAQLMQNFSEIKRTTHQKIIITTMSLQSNKEKQSSVVLLTLLNAPNHQSLITTTITEHTKSLQQQFQAQVYLQTKEF